MSDLPQITVTYVGQSDCTDYPGAVDATLTIGSRDGCEVTLLPPEDREASKCLGIWGPSIDFWASDETCAALYDADEPHDLIAAIEAEVEEAAGKAGLLASA